MFVHMLIRLSSRSSFLIFVPIMCIFTINISCYKILILILLHASVLTLNCVLASLVLMLLYMDHSRTRVIRILLCMFLNLAYKPTVL